MKNEEELLSECRAHWETTKPKAVFADYWLGWKASRSAMFRSKNDLLVKVFLPGEGDDPFIFAVNGHVSIDGLAGIEEELTGGDHEFSNGPGDYTYVACYDDGQYDEMGRCELRPGWELTLVSFEIPEAMKDEPVRPPDLDEGDPCPNCGVIDCYKDPFNGCIPF